MIYHYTGGESIPSILSMKDKRIHLRFTRYDCLNDSSEGDELFKTINIVAERNYKKKRITKHLWELIKTEYESHKDNTLFLENVDSDGRNHSIMKSIYTGFQAYICCFSNEPDLVDMWRYYSKGDTGYSLGFDSALFEKALKKEYYDLQSNDKKIYKPSFEKVIYDNTDKEQIIEECFEDCFKQKASDSSDKAFASNLYKIVSKYRFIFKHSCFSNEKETRGVIYIPTNLKSTTDKTDESFPIKYRESRGCIIPFLELTFEPSLLFGIMVSPVADDSALRLMKEYYSAFLGHHSAESHVKKSELPVRFL